MFTAVLIDPMGLLNVKYVSLMVILSLMIILNSPICFTSMNLAISFILIIFSFAFVLKQEILYYFDDSMNIIFSTLFLAGIFILNRSQKCIKSFVLACKVILLVNLGFVYLALQHIDIALGINIALKQYKMFSLEQRGHLFSDYTFYHNSIYITVLLLPLFIKEIKTAKELNWRVLVNILCLLSLLLSQSRTIYFAFVIYFILNYPRGGICIVTSLVIYVILFELKLDDSSLTKINYLDAFWLQFSDFKSVVVGTGPLSVDWGANTGEHAVIELTYIELLRYFGVIGYGALIFIALLFVYQGMKNRLSVSQAQGGLVYLSILAVNPYIWGITGLPMLLLFLSRGYNDG